MEILNEQGKALKGSKILVLGVAYKKDIDDYRESPVLPILDKLTNFGAEWVAVDPYVSEFKLNGNVIKTEAFEEHLFTNTDLTIIATNHTDFDYNLIQDKSAYVFDTRNAYNKQNLINYTKL